MKKYVFIFFLGVVLINAILADLWIARQKIHSKNIPNPKNQEVIARKISPISPICPKSPTPNLRIIPTPQVYVTTILQDVNSEKVLREYIINFGSSVWTASNWQNVPDLIKGIDLSPFGNIKNIYFEVVAHLSNDNTSGSVRLYNVSDKKVVDGSEVDFNSMKCQPMTSVAINLESYSKEYQIQVKSTENSTLYIDSAHLRIVSQ
jgi:hypothetical protein